MTTRKPNALRAKLPLHLAALSYAYDMLGVEEVKGENGDWSNWGPEIKKFLRSADIGVPAPWCLAFLNWCGEQAAFDKGVKSPLEDVPQQAYVPSLVKWAELNDRFISPEEAGPGDIFVVWFSSLNRFAHAGFVVEVHEADKWMETIEGNSNDGGSRDGYKVVRRRRNVEKSTKFIRWD